MWRGQRKRSQLRGGEPALRFRPQARRRVRKNFQGDAMVRERKDRRVNWAGPDRRSCRRKNPQAAPAPTRLLEKNSMTMEDESVCFDEGFWRRREFFDWESLRILRAAKFVYRTNSTFGRACRADERAEVHERRIMRCGAARGEKIGRVTPNCFAASGCIDRIAYVEQAGDDAGDVCFDQWN